MTIQALTTQYVIFRKSAGADFQSAQSLLKTFCRRVGGQTEAGEIRNEQIQAFLAGNKTANQLLAS